MIIKLSQLLDVEKPLAELMEQQLPLKISYQLAKVLRKASDEMKEFYRLREELFKKLGIEEEDGKFTIPDDKKEDFTKEIMELAEIEVDMAEFEPISVADFEGTDIKMSPMQLATLDQFFKD